MPFRYPSLHAVRQSGGRGTGQRARIWEEYAVHRAANQLLAAARAADGLDYGRASVDFERIVSFSACVEDHRCTGAAWPPSAKLGQLARNSARGDSCASACALLRKAALAFSIRCHRSATSIAFSTALLAACGKPLAQSQTMVVISGMLEIAYLAWVMWCTARNQIRSDSLLEAKIDPATGKVRHEHMVLPHRKRCTWTRRCTERS